MANNFPLILIFLFLSCPPITTTTSTTTVVDYFGEPIKPRTKYYFIIPGTFHFLGSTTMLTKPNQPTCPKYVAISRYPNDLGPGIEFYPAYLTHETITLSSKLKIAFSGSSNCTGKPVWKVTKDGFNGGAYVTTDGELGDDTDITESWFEIVKVDISSFVTSYEIRHCSRVECGILGLDNVDNMNFWLSLGDNSIECFVFRLWPASIKPPVTLFSTATSVEALGVA